MRRYLLTVILVAVVAGVLVGRHAEDESLLPPPAEPTPEFLRAKLNVVIPEVHFVATPLDQALDRLSQQSGAVLATDWEDLASCGIQRNAPVTLRVCDLSLGRALELIADQVGGTVHIGVQPREDGAVVIATMERVDSLEIAARLYNVRDLIGPLEASFPDQIGSGIPRTHLEQLKDLIEDNIGADSWRDRGGQSGQIEAGGGFLLVFQSPRIHRQLELLLYGFRNLHTGGPSAGE